MVKTYIPTSLKDALKTLSCSSCHIFAGGTDLMVIKRNTPGLAPTFEKDVMFISHVKELKYIKKIDNNLHIGALATLTEILNHKDTPKLFKDVIVEIASVNIRNTATLAGNIANASPAGDSIVVDVLYDAIVKVTSLEGSRLIKASDFVKGIRKIDLKEGELIEEIIIPLTTFTKTKWVKVGSRKADSISKVSFAGAYTLKDNKISDIRLALGSVFIKVVRDLEIEKTLIGMSTKEVGQNVDVILSKYDELVKPITDQRSNATYRKTVAMNIIREFLLEVSKGE